jgi:hypothetical protein
MAGSIQLTVDGGYIIAGYSGSDSVWLTKTDINGNEIWNQTFTGPFFNVAKSVQQINEGGYILFGTVNSGYSTSWLIKTDANGNEIWNRTFIMGNSVMQTKDEGYIIAGKGLIKIDRNGNEIWSNNLDWFRGQFSSTNQ